jgi:hypothetical protein
MKGIYLQNKYPILLKNNANVLNRSPPPPLEKREHEKKQQKEYRNNYL